VAHDEQGRRAEVTVIAGALEGRVPKAPPPRSWASRPGSDVAIWCVRMDAGASLSLPPAASAETSRTLYFFRGPGLDVNGERLMSHGALAMRSDVPLRLTAGAAECEVLVLQGRPIGEPVVAHGPFVMNAPREIQEAMDDYRRTQFGGWPWPVDDPVHRREEGRFARHADGRVERVER
jgi:hypothetical protein